MEIKFKKLKILLYFGYLLEETIVQIAIFGGGDGTISQHLLDSSPSLGAFCYGYKKLFYLWQIFCYSVILFCEKRNIQPFLKKITKSPSFYTLFKQVAKC
jgi:hypothetical protein